MKLIFLSLLYCLFLTSCSISKNTGGEKNIITLLYYPECNYSKLGNVYGEHGMDRLEYHENIKYSGVSTHYALIGNQMEALRQLKTNAMNLGADAIAIIDYKVLHQKVINSRGKSVLIRKYIYRAAAIKLDCQNHLDNINAVNDKPVRYLEDGSMNLGRTLKHEVSVSLTIKEQNNGIKETLIPENKVFLNGKIFGFFLGQDKTVVLNKLGSVSAMINYQDGKKAYLFGRRHVFYFTKYKLIGYEYTNWLLPPHLSNKFDYHVTFDEIDWVLEEKIKIGTSLMEIKKVLNKEIELTNGNKAVVNDDKVEAVLSFLNQKNFYDDDKMHYKFNGVSIFSKDDSFATWKQQDDVQRDITELSELMSNSRSKVISKLGQPSSIIYKSLGKDIWVYGKNLQIKFLNDSVFSYSQNKDAN